MKQKLILFLKKSLDGKFSFNNPSKYLIDYLGVQGVTLKPDYFVKSKKMTQIQKLK